MRNLPLHFFKTNFTLSL